MYALKLSDGNTNSPVPGSPVYNIGDIVDLTLMLDGADADTLGQTIPVVILDVFDNVIANLTAERVGDFYYTNWKVPFSLPSLYNPTKLTDTSLLGGLYYLKDKWIFTTDNSSMSFNFNVSINMLSPVSDNCQYTIQIDTPVTIYDSIESAEISIEEELRIDFTSPLSPAYCTVREVRDTFQEIFGTIDSWTIIREILMTSLHVDLHMAPNKIYHQAQFDLAKKLYTKYQVAHTMLNSLLNFNDEEKTLDAMTIKKKSGDPDRMLSNLEDLTYKYAKIIWAGGNDTPFIAKTFVKGLYDPNRVNANRLGLDTSDPYPWVNQTTNNALVEINGNMVELRGTRTLTFYKDRNAYPNIYLRSEGFG